MVRMHSYHSQPGQRTVRGDIDNIADAVDQAGCYDAGSSATKILAIFFKNAVPVCHALPSVFLCFPGSDPTRFLFLQAPASGSSATPSWPVRSAGKILPAPYLPSRPEHDLQGIALHNPRTPLHLLTPARSTLDISRMPTRSLVMHAALEDIFSLPPSFFQQLYADLSVIHLPASFSQLLLILWCLFCWLPLILPWAASSLLAASEALQVGEAFGLQFYMSLCLLSALPPPLPLCASCGRHCDVLRAPPAFSLLCFTSTIRFSEAFPTPTIVLRWKSYSAPSSGRSPPSDGWSWSGPPGRAGVYGQAGPVCPPPNLYYRRYLRFCSRRMLHISSRRSHRASFRKLPARSRYPCW